MLRNSLKLLLRRGRKAPFFTMLTTNVRCNARCPYCFEDAYNRTTPDMPWEAMRRIIDELGALGCLEITLQGGETLLRRDVATIVGHILARGMRPRLVTNGILLEKRLNDLAGIGSIGVSLDGDEDFNDTSKNTPGYFRKAVAGLRAARARGIPCSIICQMIPGTDAQLPFLFGLARELGIGVQFLYTFHSDEHDKQEAFTGGLSGEPYRALVRTILEAKAQGEPVLASRRGLLHSAAWDATYGRPHCANRVTAEQVPDGVPMPRCFAGRNLLHIEADGDVWPCSLNPVKGANIFALGSVDAAMDRLEELRDHCVDCVNPPHIDTNAVLSLHPGTILNYLKALRSTR